MAVTFFVSNTTTQCLRKPSNDGLAAYYALSTYFSNNGVQLA